MTLSYLIDRVRAALNQYVLEDEAVATRDDIKHAISTKFSDDDLTLRFDTAQYSIMQLCDALYFRDQIVLYTGSLPRLDNSFLRPTSRVYRDGIRCTRRPQQTQGAIDLSLRSATDAYPVYTIGESYLDVYPAGGTVTLYVVNPPPAISTGVTLPNFFEEAMVQMVLQSCRISLSEDMIDAERQGTLSQIHESEWMRELEPYLINTKLTSYADNEVAVERKVAS